jgi:hypothetical protein
MQKKSSLVYAIATGVVVVLVATPAFARQAQKSNNMNGNQLQAASTSYALAPQIGTVNRSGQCWIATDSSRGFGYAASCANPLAQDPSLNPTYNPQW